MNTLSAGSSLIWFLAEFEATAAHYPETTPAHFQIACFKLCDLDVEEFLRNAPEDAQNKREKIVGDAKGLKEQVSRKCGAVTMARRRLREALGKGRQGDAEAPLHRTAEARAVFLLERRRSRTTAPSLARVRWSAQSSRSSLSPWQRRFWKDGARKAAKCSPGHPGQK